MSAARVVVACRLTEALRFADRATEVLAAVEGLVDRARGVGGAVVATSFDGVVFAWDEGSIQEAVGLATGVAHAKGAAEARGAGEAGQASPTAMAWACGVSSGDLAMGKPRSPGAPPLHWGAPLAVASALARLARPHEVLVDAAMAAVAQHELLTNRARVGQIAGQRVRGLRLEPRQAWRALAAADVAKMVDPPLVGREPQLERLLSATAVILLRADSGFGGSRILAEVATRTAPARSITLTPFSAVHEPLGALRRAMAFVAATERITLPPKLHPVLDQLLGSQGVTIENAALLIAHQIQRRKGEPVPSLLLDDATDLDEPSIAACARAIEMLGPDDVRVVARIDSMSQLPRGLARFSGGEAVTLGRIDEQAALAIAGCCTGGALEAAAGRQWARRGGGTPLGVVEAVAAGIATGELLWDGDTLSRMKRGDDVARPVAYWIARRAETLGEPARDVLIALAHLGGEASASELAVVVKAVAPEVDVEKEVVLLGQSRWIRENREGMFVLATRAQREAILEFSRSDHHSREWRTAVAKALDGAPGTLRRAEAAQHAARAGLGEWASRLAIAAARTAAKAGLEESASTLAAFAGVQNPAAPDLSLGELALDDEAVPVGALPITDELLLALPQDEEAPPISDVDGLLLELDAPAPRQAVAPARKSSRALELVIQPDEEPLGPVAPVTGAAILPAVGAASMGSPGSAHYERLIEAAKELRETQWVEVARRSLADGAKPAVQRRGLLALARAYAQEGRSGEALIHALDALARMKETSDLKGTRTCLLFLARLYEQTERPEAVTLKSAAQAAR